VGLPKKKPAGFFGYLPGFLNPGGLQTRLEWVKTAIKWRFSNNKSSYLQNDRPIVTMENLPPGSAH